MISQDDVIDALTKAAAYDAAHTPKTSRALVHAWLEHFHRFAPNATRDDLLSAVSEYHREPRERMLQPADLSGMCRALRSEALGRMSPEDRPHRNTVGELPDYPDKWDSEQRLRAYWHAIRTALCLRRRRTGKRYCARLQGRRQHERRQTPGLGEER
jgi:hypothetical protein